MSDRIATAADAAVRECIATNRSFALIAGAGSGKTTSLVDALDEIRNQNGAALRQIGQRVACITYTERAVEVLRSKLGFDDLYHVNTLHSFLWGEIRRFQKDILDILQNHRLPYLIAKAKEKDTGRDTKEAHKAREQVARLEAELATLPEAPEFAYDNATFSDYQNGRLNHDDIIEVAAALLNQRPRFRRLVGLRYPYIFVDEAQDTFENVVSGLNMTADQIGLPLVGYFGDPWQQIYENRAGDFAPPPGGLEITKTENFRSAPQIIDFLNAFRRDVEQFPAGDNKDIAGSVQLHLVQAENPEGDRKRYTDAQIERALGSMDHALGVWGWSDRNDVIRLFLVRQMIARRLGFSTLHQLFTGTFASARAQDDYESGDHFLLKPFLKTLCPLMAAYRDGESRRIVDILRADSPAFSIIGPNAKRSLKEMIEKSKRLLTQLFEVWEGGTNRDVLTFCQREDLVELPARLREHLGRDSRQEDYDEALHSLEKADWLVDSFFSMSTAELPLLAKFIEKNTAYSTQHGVKGEEYPDVLVVFDDVEAAWNQYSFTKLLTPLTAGQPTDGQRDRGRKLAYVCFSRARVNLRILLFTPNPAAACAEIIGAGLLEEAQITIEAL